MKLFLQGIAWICCVWISGCNTLLPRSPGVQNDSIYIYQGCTEENSQSGYYYNGYQENGWRYYVEKW